MQSLLYAKGSDGLANASLMTVTNTRSPGASTIITNTVANAPSYFFGSMGTPHTFTDPVTGETITVISDATAVDFAGHIDSGHVEIISIAPGYTDLGSQVGDIIVIRPITEWANNIFNVLNAEHKDDGAHKAVTADSIVVAGASTSGSFVVSSTNQDLSNQNLFTNAIINGGCQIAQRAVPTISNTYQYGKVDRFAAKGGGTAVSAGTITQLTSSLLAATKGYDLQLAGVTLTGTGVAYLRYRMESDDALNFVNAAASFGVRVYHNVGSAVNYTIYIRKATALNNFASVTDIANSGVISVPNTTATAIKFENINSGNLGDVTNGIEIEIQIACGAITTKNFNFAEFVFNKGAKAAPFIPRSQQQELAACQRYFEKSYSYSVAPGTAASSQLLQHNSYNSGNTISNTVPFKVTKRAVPTVTVWDPAGNINKVGWAPGTTSATIVNNTNEPTKTIVDSGYWYSSGGMTTASNGTSSSNWIADAEL